MGQLTVERKSFGEVGVLRVQGSVDAGTSGTMEQGLREVVEAGAKKVVVVMQNVAFMSSAGWGILLGILKEIRAKGGAMAIAQMSPEIRHVYHLLGMKAFMKEFASEEEAIAALR